MASEWCWRTSAAAERERARLSNRRWCCQRIKETIAGGCEQRIIPTGVPARGRIYLKRRSTTPVVRCATAVVVALIE